MRFEMMNDENIPPLRGIKVLDLSQAYSAPLCGMMLGDMGADVIKIERLQGEAMRYGRAAGMDDLDKGKGEKNDASVFLAVNRSKRSLVVDIKQEEGKEIMLKLAGHADVFIENFRPGVMDHLGLGYERVCELNPQIIYASLTGWGDKGPLAHRIGGDMWAQAMGGVVSRQGSVDGPPSLSGIAFVDQGTAGIMAFGIMVALFVRQRSGVGQYMSVNLLHSLLHMESTEVSEYLIDGRLVTKIGRGLPPHVVAPPAGVYPAKDGDVVTIFGTGKQWPIFCNILGVQHLENDPRFTTDDLRIEHREQLYLILDQAFAKKTRIKWQQLFKEAKLRCDPCLNYEELFAHPQVEANEMLTSLMHPVRGSIKMVNAPIKFSKTRPMPCIPPPLLGEHSKEILLELGYSELQINELIRKEIIKVYR
jgi:crotonobetainyl-CoA:carnitine CoA-transferase CaiB-like acyl-CoA transferase